MTLPDGNPVWIQANAKGERYVPFRLDIKNSKSTWTGSLPHDRADQVNAQNHGRARPVVTGQAVGTSGVRGDAVDAGILRPGGSPFYYALADAFTICDQHFCSCLTPTTPNRLYLWSGTIRERQAANAGPTCR